MPNHHGPDNGPGRLALATKWKDFGIPAADVDRHVDALREHVAIQVAQKIGLLQRSANHSAQGGDAASASPERKRAQAGAAECTAAPVSNKQARAASGSEFSCGVRLTGRPGDPIPGGGLLSKQSHQDQIHSPEPAVATQQATSRRALDRVCPSVHARWRATAPKLERRQQPKCSSPH